MDDSANVDLVDVSPIGSPDHFQITTKKLWRVGEPHSDDEMVDSGNVANNSEYHCGSYQWLPHPQGGFRRIKPLALDTNLPPPFLYSPSTVEETPSPLSHTSDYFSFEDRDLLPPVKVGGDMRFQHHPRPSIYDPDEPNGVHAWDLHSDLPALWDAGDDSDASESLDDSKGYITFTEPSAFVLDFPEDVDEFVEHDAVFVDGDSGAIGRPLRSTSVPASEIPVELSAKISEDSQIPPVYALDVPLPQIREFSEDGDELEPFSRLSYPASDVADAVPINVSLSPLILATDGFPDDTPLPYVDVETEITSADMGWLEEPWGEVICSPRSGELVEWDRWRGQLVEELDRDLDSWARVHEGVRVGLERL